MFGTDKYKTLCEDLGNGILSMMNVEKGTYYHVLNMDFSKKEEFRTIYYDGEATYALAILYGMTKEDKWLNAAKSAVEHFIEADYTKHRDHWVAYAVNELTKYDKDERYFEFGLRNAQVNLERIYNQNTSYHTYLELLMCTFDLYSRIIEENIQVEYLKQFDKDAFINTILHRAEHMLNGYLYPEYAMYLKQPSKIVGTFCVRHDGYRIRIDDVQHFIAGYYHLLENYEKIMEYKMNLKKGILLPLA